MDVGDNSEIKSPSEIALLVKKLSQVNQSYVLNTIDALLFSQSIQKEKSKKHEKKFLI